MKSATGTIDLGRTSKQLCSAFFVTGALIWLLMAAAHATPSRIPSATEAPHASDTPAFELVQAQELETSLPTSLGEIISTVPDSLKLDLSMRVNRVFRMVFESDADGSEESSPLILIEEDKSRKLADVPETLIPASGEAAGDAEQDDMGWSIFEGAADPLIHRQMYRTDI